MTSLFITYYFVNCLEFFFGDMGLSCSFDSTEIEAYNILPPGVRVVILKALCDIRVEVFMILKSSSLCTMWSDEYGF